MSGPTLRVVLAPRAALDARRLVAEAAVLARALDAELAALFVEESDLLRCVALPFTVEVGLVSGAVLPADPEATRRLLVHAAEELRALLAQAAAGLGLSWSFAVARGNLVGEALAAASADLVLLAPPGGAPAVGPAPPSGGRRRVAVLDEPAGALAEAAGASASGGPGEGTPAGRAWAAAVRFAGGRPDAIDRIRPGEVVHGPAPRVLVVSLAAVAGRPVVLERLLAGARCPVVLVA